MSLAIAFLTAGLASPCGDSGPSTLFSWVLHPDLPLEPFAAGRIGVLDPAFAESYLAVAYAHMRGTVFDDKQQADLVAIWKHRMRMSDERRESALEAWVSARAGVPIAEIPAPGYRLSVWDNWGAAPGGYGTYVNCLDDAFRRAVSTLNEKYSPPGTLSAETREWLIAQDAVFSNCSGKASTLPLAVPPNASYARRADRAYQRASAFFYSGRFPEAERAFRTIALDHQSPWRPLSAHLVARSMIRQAFLATLTGYDEAGLVSARKELEGILSDQTLHEVHKASRRLLALVRNKIEPQARLRELADSIVSAKSEAAGEDLNDLIRVMDSQRAWAGGGTEEQNEARRQGRIAALREAHDMIDWIAAFRGPATHSRPDWVTWHGRPDLRDATRSLDRWRASRLTPWLVASLSQSKGDETHVGELLRDAAAVAPESAAFPTVTLHAARLQLAQGNAESARAILDRLKDGVKPDLGRSSLNRLLDLRAMASLDLDDFLRHAVQFAVGEGYSFDVGAPCLDPVRDTVCELPAVSPNTEAVVMRMSLTELLQATRSKALPASVRESFLLTAWSRATVLERDAEALDMARSLGDLNDTFKARFARYLSTDDAENRAFEATDIMVDVLLSPTELQPWSTWSLGVSPRGLGWWCGPQPEGAWTSPIQLPRSSPASSRVRPGPSGAGWSRSVPAPSS